MAKAKKRGIFARLFTRGADQGGGWLSQKLLLGLSAKSGRMVSASTAMQVTAVLACVRVIAEDSAITPLIVKTRAPNGKWKREEDHWLIRRFRKPNEWQTEIEFRSMLTAHAVLCPGGYAFINRGVNGTVTELLPYPPGAVKVKQANWEIAYEVTYPNGTREQIPSANMLHLRGLTWDGVNGLDVVTLAREAIGIAMATEDSHALLHKNGIKTSGILTTNPAAPILSEEASKRIAQQWRENFGPDSGNEFGVAVLEGGMKFEQIGMSGVDAEHLATRRFQIEEICRAFRVYPQMIGAESKSASFASSEQFFIAHVNHTIRPWCERWAQMIDRALLAPSSEPNTWVSFDLRGLQPGDSKTRAAYLNSGINAGWLNRNEARELEGYERGPDALDEFIDPQQAPGNSADATNAKNEQVSNDEASGNGA